MLCSILKKRWNSSVLRMSVDGKSHLFAVLWRVAGATGCGRIASLLQLIEAKCFRTVSIRKVPSPIIPYPVYTAVVGRLCGNGSVPPYVVGGDGGLLRRSPSLGVSVCLCVRGGTELRCRRREGSPGVVPVGAVAVILRGEIGFSRTGYVSTV